MRKNTAMEQWDRDLKRRQSGDTKASRNWRRAWQDSSASGRDGTWDYFLDDFSLKGIISYLKL